MERLNELPQMNMDRTETGCCPRFQPDSWNEKIISLHNLPMVKASTRSLFYIPLNMGKVMTDTMSKIVAANAEETERYLILSEELTPFRGMHHFLVKKNVPDLENELLSGTFFTMVFNGNYNQIPKWMKEMQQKANEEQLTIKRYLSFYTTCPKCAATYGNNYVVLFGELTETEK